MTTPAEFTYEWLGGIQKQMFEQVSALGLRLASWLILGNAAALVFIFKAVLDGTHCSQRLLQTSIWCFAFGLFLAFSASALTYLNGFFSLRTVMRIVEIAHDVRVKEYYEEQLKAEGVEIPADSPLVVDTGAVQSQLGSLKKRSERLQTVFWISMFLYGLSALSLALGVVTPVSGAEMAYQTCTKIQVK